MTITMKLKSAGKKTTVKKPKDKNAPKPPLSAYLRFGKQQRAADPTLSALPVVKQGKVLSEMWSQLSEGAKEEYKNEYLKDREAYMEELEAYKKTDKYKEYQELLKATKYGKDKKPKKQSAYNEYYKEQYGLIFKDNKTLEMKDITAIIVKNWKEIDNKTKQIYVDRANKVNEANKENKKSQDDD